MQLFMLHPGHRPKYCMKKLVAGFAMIMLFAGCAKNNTLFLQQQLAGRWELTRTVGGWSGIHDYEPGNGNTIFFDEKTYTRHYVYTDTSFVKQGTYALYRSKIPCGNEDEVTLINFDDAPLGDLADVITVSAGQLTIGSSPCVADGETSYYRSIP